MALDTVANYVSEARTLLQDLVPPYRYADLELISGLNFAVLEGRRLRPDLFRGVVTLPSFTANDGTAVAIDPMYRVAFLYYVCSHAQLRDEEDTQPATSASYRQKFFAQLLSLS